jgi:hypothetical protein
LRSHPAARCQRGVGGQCRVGARLHGRRAGKTGGHAVQFGLRDELGCAIHVAAEDVVELGVDGIEVLLTLGLHQDLDARLIEVVAPAEAVVDAHNCLQVQQDLLPGHESADLAGHDGGAAHAAAHQHAEAHLAGRVALQLQAHVMPGDGGAVLTGTGDGDLELARQEGELRVQRAPLPQHFGVGARIHHLINGHAGQGVGGDVADAVAAGLDAVHVHCGQAVHRVGRLHQWDPVVLDVLAGGEMRIAAVEVAGDGGQRADLVAGDGAVGHGHAQHRRMALDVPAVLQAQRAELVIGERAGEVALQLVAELGRSGVDELAVKVGVAVHVVGVRKSKAGCRGSTAGFGR